MILRVQGQDREVSSSLMHINEDFVLNPGDVFIYGKGDRGLNVYVGSTKILDRTLIVAYSIGSNPLKNKDQDFSEYTYRMYAPENVKSGKELLLNTISKYQEVIDLLNRILERQFSHEQL